MNGHIPIELGRMEFMKTEYTIYEIRVDSTANTIQSHIFHWLCTCLQVRLSDLPCFAVFKNKI